MRQLLIAGLVLAAFALTPVAIAEHDDPEKDCQIQSAAGAIQKGGYWVYYMRPVQVIEGTAAPTDTIIYQESNGLPGLQTEDHETCGHGHDTVVL